MARRDDGEYRDYLTEEQRSQRGCIVHPERARPSTSSGRASRRARRMQPDFHHGLVTKLRLKPPSKDSPRSGRESSLLGGRRAAAKTASKAAMAKTCFTSPEQGFR